MKLYTLQSLRMSHTDGLCVYCHQARLRHSTLKVNLQDHVHPSEVKLPTERKISAK